MKIINDRVSLTFEEFSDISSTLAYLSILYHENSNVRLSASDQRIISKVRNFVKSIEYCKSNINI